MFVRSSFFKFKNPGQDQNTSLHCEVIHWSSRSDCLYDHYSVHWSSRLQWTSRVDCTMIFCVLRLVFCPDKFRFHRDTLLTHLKVCWFDLRDHSIVSETPSSVMMKPLNSYHERRWTTTVSIGWLLPSHRVGKSSTGMIPLSTGTPQNWWGLWIRWSWWC
jgi:hypothetical protein